MLNSTSMRSRAFSRSLKSAISIRTLSSRTKGLAPSPPIVTDKDNDNVKEKVTSDKATPIRPARSKRGMDANPADRLSTIFGAPFVGKSRKPPPRFVRQSFVFPYILTFGFCY